MKFLIKNTITGEVKEVEVELPEDPYYILTDGNYSCDCNRALFFGDEYDKCTEGVYLVRLDGVVEEF